MSLILDALRKSEQERRQAETPVLVPLVADAPSAPRRRLGAVLFLTLGIVGVVALAGYWSANRSGIQAPAPGVPAAARSAPVAEPRTAPAAAVPPAPVLTPNPFAVANDGGKEWDLAHEARVPRPAPPVPAAEAPTPVAFASSAPATRAAPPADETVKFLRSMPPEFQRALPELVVNIHIYAPNEAERILYINNRQYRAGERVRDDIVVEEIVEDGAVLSYRGQRFKLPRPS